MNNQRTIVDFIKLDSGIDKLLDLYEDLIVNKPKEFHQIASHYQTIVFLKTIMSKNQWNRFEEIKQKESKNQYFMCGTCGFQGEMILIYRITNKDFITIKRPSYSSVENWANIYSKAFGNDVVISKAPMP